MGIKFRCPNGHKLNVKSFLAGKTGICPHCGVRVRIPADAEREADGGADETLSGARGATATAVMAGATTSLADTATLEPVKSRPAPSTVASEVSAAAPVSTPAAAATTQQSVASSPAATVTPAVAAPAPMSPAAMPATAAVAASPASPVVPSMPAGNGAPVASAVPATAVPVAAAPVAAPISPYAAMPHDAIAEAPNAVWYVRPPSGGQFGPARGDIMRKWLGEGRVSADSLVWRDGWADWKSAATVFPSLATAGGVAPVAAAIPTPAVGVSAQAPSPARVLRARKRSTGFAVAMVITLGLITIVLLGLFVAVISGSLQL